MAFDHRPGQFTMFVNDNRTGDNHPHFKGRGKLPDGTPMEIAAWAKEGQRGTYFSIQISPGLPRGASEQGGAL